MATAQLIFLFGATQTHNQRLCKAVGIFLHFFLTAMFSWMLVEGWHLYLSLLKVFSSRKKTFLKRYYLLGYGLPSVILALSLTVFWDSYGTGKVCWVAEQIMVSLFLPPIAAILLANIVIMGMVIGVLLSPNRPPEKHKKEASKMAAIKQGLKASLILCLLLGVTWIFGFLQISADTLTITYLFVILNSFQGVFLFIFHCFLSQEVRNAYNKHVLRRERYFSSLSSTTIGGLRVPKADRPRKDRDQDLFSSSVSTAKAYNQENVFTVRRHGVLKLGSSDFPEDPNAQVKREWQEANEYTL